MLARSWGRRRIRTVTCRLWSFHIITISTTPPLLGEVEGVVVSWPKTVIECHCHHIYHLPYHTLVVIHVLVLMRKNLFLPFLAVTYRTYDKNRSLCHYIYFVRDRVMFSIVTRCNSTVITNNHTLSCSCTYVSHCVCQ